MLESEIYYPTNYRLERLHRALNATLGSSTLYWASFFGPAAFLAVLAGFAAVLFAPWVLWQLYRLGRYGWIAAFVILVCGPGVLPKPGGLVGAYLTASLPLIAFYGYTFLLRLACNNWVEADRGQAMLRWQAFRDRHPHLERRLAEERAALAPQTGHDEAPQPSAEGRV